MRRRERVQIALYRRLVIGLGPPAHRARHGDDQVQLFTDLMASGRSGWRLWSDALVDLVVVTLRAPTLKGSLAQAARLALWPLSVLNLLAGIAIAAVAASNDVVPLWVMAPAAALMVQAGFTISFQGGLLSGDPRLTRAVFVAGEAVALTGGTTGAAIAVTRQLGTTDPEYGPMTIVGLVAIHALAGVLAALDRPQTNGSPDGLPRRTRPAG